MAPLIVMVVSLVAVRSLGLTLSWHQANSCRGALRFALAAMFVFTAIAHFHPRTRPDLIRMVPAKPPAAPFLVTATGVFELAGALGFLIPDVAVMAAYRGAVRPVVQRILQVSAGFTYTYSASGAPGSKVSDIRLNGTPIDPAATYRVTINNFLAGGGDGFSTLTAGTDRVSAPGFDVDALVAYIGAGTPVAPGPANRITIVQ